MGSSSPDVPGADAPAERPERSELTPIDFPAQPERPDVYLRRERRGYRVRDPLWRYIVLFVLTVLTTTAAGAFPGKSGGGEPMWAVTRYSGGPCQA